MRKGILAAVLCAALLLTLAAAAENTVEILPTAAPMPEPAARTNEYGFSNLDALYQDEWEYQTPSLTKTEEQRIPEALRRWEAGERPESSVLNVTEHVKLSLIQLPAEQYEGEKWFLLLPNYELSDDELLQLVDAYGQLGIRFDPDLVTWHNCMRGGLDELRGWAGDESDRYEAIGGLFIRSGLRPATPCTRSVTDDGIGYAELDEESYNGANFYLFLPARRVTDEELLQIYALYNREPAAAPADLAGYEKQLRQQLHDLMGMPLSAKRREEEDVRAAGEYDVYGDGRQAYYTAFLEIGGQERYWRGGIDISTGRLIEADVDLDRRYATDSLFLSDILMDPWDAQWEEIARETVTSLRKPGTDGIRQILAQYDQKINFKVHCAVVRVTMEDGSVYTVHTAYNIRKAVTVSYKDAYAISLEDAYHYRCMDDWKGQEDDGNE